ncbi:hypothetical protein [Staphylococcus gallinarum]|uniref:hypothetical protein n=1 Tax=Staphylococcus gallinarum TaxID=1293 RepID=UPI0030BD6254
MNIYPKNALEHINQEYFIIVQISGIVLFLEHIYLFVINQQKLQDDYLPLELNMYIFTGILCGGLIHFCFIFMLDNTLKNYLIIIGRLIALLFFMTILTMLFLMNSVYLFYKFNLINITFVASSLLCLILSTRLIFYCLKFLKVKYGKNNLDKLLSFSEKFFNTCSLVMVLVTSTLSFNKTNAPIDVYFYSMLITITFIIISIIIIIYNYYSLFRKIIIDIIGR